MVSDGLDPRMMSVHPRIRYNTIGGVNGPLVILENVGRFVEVPSMTMELTLYMPRSNSRGTTRLCP